MKVSHRDDVGHLEIRFPHRLTLNKQKIDIRVFGAARATDDADTLEICFEGFELGGLPTIPLPRPVGRIVTTFVDDDLRLSRGSRGGLFVLKRIR